MARISTRALAGDRNVIIIDGEQEEEEASSKVISQIEGQEKTDKVFKFRLREEEEVEEGAHYDDPPLFSAFARAPPRVGRVPPANIQPGGGARFPNCDKAASGSSPSPPPPPSPSSP